jgi:putative peptidoglycan lipid II flippase
VIGTAIGTALLPMLTRAIRGVDAQGAHKLFMQGFEISLLLALPAAACYIIMAPDLMSVLFERGKFTSSDSLASAYALIGYSIGLPAFILSKVFGAVFYARQDTATPVKSAVICAILNTLLALALMTQFKHVGIAMATGLTAWIDITLLLYFMRKKGIERPSFDSVKRVGVILICTLAMSATLYVGSIELLPRFKGDGQTMAIIGLTLLLGTGGVVYAIGLYFAGILRPDYIKALFPKRKKQDTIVEVQNDGP